MRSLVVLMAFSAFLLLNQSFSFPANPLVITKTDLRDVQAQMQDSNLLVWGAGSDGSISVQVYNSSLQLVANYKKTVPEFSAKFVRLVFSDVNLLEFVATGNGEYNQVFIRLTPNLEEIYVSRPFKNEYGKVPDTDDTMSVMRNSTVNYTIRYINYREKNGDTVAFTAIYKGVEYNYKFGFSDTSAWMRVLDSSRVEYAKLFSSHNGRVYAYVNFSEAQGQYICCFDEKDGKEIYKTKLQLKGADFKRGEAVNSWEGYDSWNDPGSHHSCIFSNYTWDERTKCLTIAGTWVSPDARDDLDRVVKTTGLFLIQLNEDGKINACDADYHYWLSSPTHGGNHAGDGFFSRNNETYYRVTSMGYEPDGYFSMFAEIYAKIYLFHAAAPGKPEDISPQDSFYHYFTLQKHVYAVTPGSIRPKCQECIVRTTPWTANHHLDSIKGFIPKQTKVYDEQYPDNINQVCDASRADGHFIAGFRTLKGKNGTKVLTCVPVEVNGEVKEAYFSKTLYIPSANWMAFLSPDPVKGQDFAKPAQYFAANSEWLYRFEPRADGYELRMVRW